MQRGGDVKEKARIDEHDEEMRSEALFHQLSRRKTIKTIIVQQDVQNKEKRLQRSLGASDLEVEKIKTAARLTYEDIAPLALLIEMYEPRCWWFEVFECVRKIALTGLPM